MARKIVCDRCGMEIVIDEQYSSIIQEVEFCYAEIDPSGPDTSVELQKDLCQNCVDAVLTVLNETFPEVV